MKRSQISIYIFWIMGAFILITIAALFGPMGVRFNTELFIAGEQIMQDAQPSIDQIQDVEIRQSINQTVTNAKNSAQFNIETNANMFRYAWIFVIALSAIVAFLYTRQLVEFGGGMV